MTTFTTNDREEAYKKILDEAPNQPGYEDAVPIPFAGWVNASPPHIVDSGASVMDELTDAGHMIGVLREHISKQADYIAQLEKALESSLTLNKAQAERNNEPVAWFYERPSETGKFMCGDAEAMKGIEKDGWVTTPLYTHPVKELTDEEIDQAWKSVDHTIEYSKYRIEIARAILRKAQEK